MISGRLRVDLCKKFMAASFELGHLFVGVRHYYFGVYIRALTFGNSHLSPRSQKRAVLGVRQLAASLLPDLLDLALSTVVQIL